MCIRDSLISHLSEDLAVELDAGELQAVHELGVGTVSYTHLDVYKRQLVRFFALLRIKPHAPLLVRAPVNSCREMFG